MKKNYIIKDRTFEVSVEPYFGPLVIIKIREIKYSNRKFFKGEISKHETARCIDSFETLDEMVLDALKEKFDSEIEKEEKNKKLEKFFENALDEPYIL